MIAVVELIFFLIYSSLIFFVKEYYFLILILVINISLMIILKINLKQSLIFILRFLPFIFFTGLLNILLANISLGILMIFKLIFVCNTTYILSKIMTPKKLCYATQNILIPLKVFNINPIEIGIMVSVAISFIPIIQKEMQNLQYSLVSKGYKLNFINIVKKPGLILVPLITETIKRTSEIEQSMISKGYIS